MTERQWHSGPPPSVGWWPASAVKDPTSVRWWNGECWSVSVFGGCDANSAARYAEKATTLQNYIEWTERWWE